VKALAASQIDAVTTDDVILAGYAAQPEYNGVLKVVGKGFSDESYGVGVKKGNTALLDQVNAALKQYIADGSWKKALDITVAPSGYKIPDPPTPGTG
jgi:glutamate transport system substrate-binding protein